MDDLIAVASRFMDDRLKETIEWCWLYNFWCLALNHLVLGLPIFANAGVF
jgi:hypothetical protein